MALHQAQRLLPADVDAGKVSKEDLSTRALELLEERIASLNPARKAPVAPKPKPAVAPTTK